MFVLLALSLFQLGAADAATPSVAIDEKSISAARAEEGELKIGFTVDEQRLLPWKGQLWLEILDQEDQVVASGRGGKTFIVDERVEVTISQGGIDLSAPENFVIHYVFAGSGARVEGRRSLAAAMGVVRTTLRGQTEWIAGSQAGLRLAVFEHYSGQPLADARITLALAVDDQQIELFQGRTDDAGTADVRFAVPDQLQGGAELRVKVDSAIGTDEIERSVYIERRAKVLVVTDKPLYQPGQTINIRALALSEPNHLPLAGKQYLIEVEDSKGNKVFKRSGDLDRFGLAHARFVLGTELNLGTYRVRVIVDGKPVERTVSVERYVLPKFKVELSTEREFYLPGEIVRGTLQADYFFGKPVAEGKVTLTAMAQDVGLSTFAIVQGATDRNGSFEFELQVPDSLVGQPLLDGKAAVVLEAAVIDQTDHEQSTSTMLPVADQALILAAIPESGDPVPGVSNKIFIIASTPDGRPARVRFDDPFNPQRTLVTDRMGLAELNTVPAKGTLSFRIKAMDDQGRSVQRDFSFEPDDGSEHLLLRPQSSLYKVGDVAELTAYPDHCGAGWVYFDVLRGKQTVLTKVARIDEGRARLELPLGDDLSGALTFSAYIITAQGQVVRDTRLAYVNPADELEVRIRPERESYRPGEPARLLFQVRTAKGAPGVVALGVNIVDESVFALQQMRPGLERVFFMLEREIMKPRYEIHEYRLERIVEPQQGLDRQQQIDRRRAYEVLLSSSEQVQSYSLEADTFQQRTSANQTLIQRVFRDHEQIYNAVQAFYQDHKRYPSIDGGLQRLVAQGLLSQSQIVDCWGNVYRVEPLYGSQTLESFKIISAGPDEAFGTADDLETGDYMWGFAQEGQMIDNMLFDREIGGAGGMRALGGAPKGAAIDEPSAAHDASTTATVEREEPRVRKYFPETLLSEPALITDAQGRATLEFDLADSITTWRATAMASDPRGLLGSASVPLLVFQEFFIDIDFPVALTQNDVVHVPVVVYNYLDTAQRVRLQAERGDWFELLKGNDEQSVELGPGEVAVAYFPIRVTGIGKHSFTVRGYGSSLSDAVQRSVDVLPDGKRFEQALNGRLEGTVNATVKIPQQAVDGGSKIYIKLHPGVMSQIVEGLDGILQMPFGCFEQTSSVTYPNVMVLQYLEAIGQLNPEISIKAEGFINSGYQRLLTYEVPGGGFEWFGKDPAHVILTAYGLMEFHDMSQVYDVDPQLIGRTQRWLASKQLQDGSWEPNERFLDRVAARFATDKLRNTAYVTWALLYSGDRGSAAKRGLSYIEKNIDQIEDSYTLALATNALATYDPQSQATLQAIEKLSALAVTDGDLAHWPQSGDTATFARGTSADIEATALAIQALLRAQTGHNLVSGAINYLIEKKDPNGTWYSTQATVWALKALLIASRGATSGTNAEILIKVNGEIVHTLAITPQDADVMRLIDLEQYTS
ncbi:MAG: alpha-2-macroglobulin family protein, partial [Candidatus Alcyoniella australis]|nr:alpha-2-macroglobulin family protein [Candidatus Alcyoniella australis]